MLFATSLNNGIPHVMQTLSRAGYATRALPRVYSKFNISYDSVLSNQRVSIDFNHATAALELFTRLTTSEEYSFTASWEVTEGNDSNAIIGVTDCPHVLRSILSAALNSQ